MTAGGAAGAIQPGVVLAGRFRIDGDLGEGGMARVFRVTDLATRRPFALKLLRADIADNAEAVARLKREAEVLDALDNPAVVGIETYGELPDRRLFIVMELLEGETLGSKMRRESRLAPEAMTPIVTGVAAGLSAAHRAGVIHRDLKPDNVFLTTGSDGDVQVKILDFGISKVYSNEERLTQTGQVLGTPRYMAPEQLGAEPDLDARTDVYALGVMLYEALAGTPPFVATTPSDLILAILHGKTTPLRTLRPDLSVELEALIARAMARARDARYRTVVELAEAWINLVGARAVASEARAGMRTKLVGSGGPLLAPAASPAGGGPSGFRIATFSELEEQASDHAAAETALGRPRPLPATRAMEVTDEPAAFAPVNVPAPAPEPYAPPAYASGPGAGGGYAPAGGGGDAAAGGGSAVGGGYVSAGASAHAAVPAAPRPDGYAPAQASYGASPAGFADDEDWGDDAPLVVPTSSRRWLWIVLALIAGALTAGLALAFLDRGMGDRQRGGGDGRDVAPAAAPDRAPATPAPATPEPSERHGEDEAPTSAEGSPIPDEDPVAQLAEAPEAERTEVAAASSDVARPAARGTRRSPPLGVTAPPITPASTPSSPFAPAPEPALEDLPAFARTPEPSVDSLPAFAPPPSREPAAPPPPDPFVSMAAADPIADARAALHANDPARCLQLLATSPRMTASRLRLEGDCHRAAGNAQDAAKSYERICALYPSYVGIADVRALAERYGGSCD